MTVDGTTNEPGQPPTSRCLDQRRADALQRLETNHQM